MESKELIYKNGHFYEANGKRVGLKDGVKITISAQENPFISFSPVGAYPLKVLNSAQKEFEIRNEAKLTKQRKIYERGSFLYFSIPRVVGEKIITHEFKVELKEELYLHLKSNWKLQEERLYNCACVVTKNISGTIDFFEEVYAESLNEAYKYTFVHYFGNEGNPACNAIDRFYDTPGKEELTISRFRG